jgi:hypothetical protein
MDAHFTGSPNRFQAPGNVNIDREERVGRELWILNAVKPVRELWKGRQRRGVCEFQGFYAKHLHDAQCLLTALDILYLLKLNAIGKLTDESVPTF